MDTKKLVAGQDVYMLKPPYPFWFCIDEGKVVRVTPEGVDVQVVGVIHCGKNSATPPSPGTRNPRPAQRSLHVTAYMLAKSPK